uniref:Uncharacterized protein n=1 Tax=Panagrolaimus sp. JU765 TaxID=591449 RepID=A0AC34RG17_9BILA
MQGSSSEFLRSLFPEKLVSGGAKAKPTSASTKIRGNGLFGPRIYLPDKGRSPTAAHGSVRKYEHDDRVLHQVKYLGLKENIRVRRAGYALRRPFEKFLWRYAILSSTTWPLRNYHGDIRHGCEIICKDSGISNDQYQLGKTKIFIKNPESLFLLEESRERKFDNYARILQKAFKKFISKKQYMKMKEDASNLFYGRKERRKFSINRNYVGDYIGIEHNPSLLLIIGKRERIDFAAKITKYDRKFKTTKLDMVLTGKNLFLIGREISKEPPNKGKLIEVIKRKLSLNQISFIGLSPFQDDFMVLSIEREYTSLLETPLKTEFLTMLTKRYKEFTGKEFQIVVDRNFNILLKKQKYEIGKPGQREIKFINGQTGDPKKDVITKVNGKCLTVTVASGLPNNTRPRYRPAPERINTRPQHHPQRIQNPPIINHAIPQQQVNPPRYDQPPPPQHHQMGGFDPKQVLNHKMGNNVVHPTAPPVAPRPGIKPKPKNIKPQVRALYDYDARDTDELTFKEGQFIELVSEDPSGWWQGKIGPKTGLFPANYVEKV